MNKPFYVGQHIGIPIHYDLWMRGATTGVITQFRQGKAGQSAFYYVKMDHPAVRRRLKLWALDWAYVKVGPRWFIG